MDILAWILAIALAGTYLGAGLVKLLRPRDKLKTQANFAWMEDFSPSAVKGIGTAEVLGAVGVIVPWLTKIAVVLTPIAGLGLFVLQIGAMITHGRRGEKKVLPANIVLALIALVFAIIRFTQL